MADIAVITGASSGLSAFVPIPNQTVYSATEK